MKFASVALSALAISLATPVLAEDTAGDYPHTVQGAADFVAAAEKDMSAFSVGNNQANWVNYTYITDDTDALAAASNAQLTEKQVQYALEAAKFADIAGLDPDVKRKLDIMRNGIVLPAPTTPGAATELSAITTGLSSQYGKGQATLDGKPINGSDVEAEMGNLNHTPAEFAEMWASWHDNVGAPMKGDYVKLVGIANEGAKELGFNDVGAMWRSGYDMTPEQFTAMTERLWQETKPLYVALHAYVRSRGSGEDRTDPGGPARQYVGAGMG